MSTLNKKNELKNSKEPTELVPSERVQTGSNSELLPLDQPLIKKNISRSTKIKFIALLIAAAALIIYLILDIALKGPLTSLLMNRDQLVASVESWGIFAPLLYILLQIIQTVAAPIPGQLVGSVGGFLFGPWGILWTTVGSLIGCWIVFKLARRFGRPLLEKIFKKSVVAKFDFILKAKSASLILFAIFLLPGFPDDVVCYIAGLTSVPIPKLMLLVALGRLPTIVMTNFIGAGISDNLGLVAAVSVVGILILGFFVWKREWIMRVLKGEWRPKNRKNKDADSQKEGK